MNLYKLLLETASEEAKKLGLEPEAFGMYSKNGKITHRSEDGKLVPVNKDDVPDNMKGPETEGGDAPKPTTMPADVAGTKPSNDVTPDDVKKSMGDGGDDTGSTGGVGDEPQQPTVTPNPNLKITKIGRPIESHKLDAHISDELLTTSKDILDDFIIGAETVIMDWDDMIDYSFHTDYANNQPDEWEISEHTIQDAVRHHKEWRTRLPTNDREKLFSYMDDWRDSGNHHKPDDYKKERNDFINSLCNKNPPICNVITALERGMRLPPEELKAYLSQYRIGESINTPPSGFSSIPASARAFCGVSSMKGKEVGIHLRLHPNKDGKVYGMRIHNDPDARRTVSEDYDHEGEVIRYTGPTAKCVKVTRMVGDFSEAMKTSRRMLYKDAHPLKVIYVIDLEEQGYPDESINESLHGDDDKKFDPIFEKIMNTSFGYWRPKKSTDIKLSTFIPENVS